MLSERAYLAKLFDAPKRPEDQVGVWLYDGLVKVAAKWSPRSALDRVMRSAWEAHEEHSKPEGQVGEFRNLR